MMIQSWTTIAVAMISLAVGCQPKNAAPPAAAPMAVAPSAADSENTSLPAATQPIDTAQAISAKAAAYSQDVSRMLNQRQTSNDTVVNGAPAPDTVQTNAGQTQVKWNDSDELSLSDQSSPPNSESTSATSTGEPVQTVIASSPGQANQVASIAPTNRPTVATDAADRATAPQPIPASITIPPVTSSDALAASFAQRVKDYPNDIAAHLDYQLLLFLNDQQVPQLSSIATLPEEDRELVTAVLDGLSNFRNAIRADNNMLLSRKVQPMLQMADRLRTQADLYIPAIALCTKVDGFGSYKAIDPPRFVAGREHPAIVYCEVANFASQLNDQKLWETKLLQEAVLYTETGLPVWQDSGKTVSDVCRNRRHDFFMVKMIKLPSTLTIGRYLLKITIIDKQASRVAEATVPIQIVAQ